MLLSRGESPSIQKEGEAFFLSTLDYSRPSDCVKGHTEAPWVQTLRLWGTSESLGPFTNKKKVKPSLLSAYKSMATAQNVMRARDEVREPANTLAATSWAKSKEKKKKKVFSQYFIDIGAAERCQSVSNSWEGQTSETRALQDTCSARHPSLPGYATVLWGFGAFHDG